MILCAVSSELRPEPGSRVQLNPANTQGAGVPFSVRPSKAKTPEQHRIQYPQNLFTAEKQFACTAVSVTAAHSQVAESKATKGARCPHVAQ